MKKKDAVCKSNGGKESTGRKSVGRCCPAKGLADRPLLSPIQAGGLASVFKVLANDTRLRLLHALVRAEEIRVTDLATSIGMKPQAVSNQLQRLADLGIVATRRDGVNIHYRIIDLCVKSLLEQGLCLIEEVSQRGPCSSMRRGVG